MNSPSISTRCDIRKGDRMSIDTVLEIAVVSAAVALVIVLIYIAILLRGIS